MAPPIDIQVVRAIPPRKSVFTPSSRTMRRILEGMDKADPLDAGSVGLRWADCGRSISESRSLTGNAPTFASSITLVLTTSSGVEMAPAKPPAMDPQSAASCGNGLRWFGR